MGWPGKGWETETLRSPRRRSLAAPQVLADYFPTSSHNDSRSIPSNTVRHVLFAQPFSRKWLGEDEMARNSFAWYILQRTSLFSIFCSATLLVTSRKQGFCVQNTGGGTRGAGFAGLSRSKGSDANLRRVAPPVASAWTACPEHGRRGQSYFLMRFSAASTLQKSPGSSWLYFT